MPPSASLAALALALLFSVGSACASDPNDAPPPFAVTDGGFDTALDAAEAGESRFNVGARHAGVFVFPPSNAADAGTVILPDGSKLDTAGTETAGLQEAIQHAVDYGWDLFIYGRGPGVMSNTYRLSRGLRFPAIQGKTIRIVDAILDYGTMSTEPAMSFDSTMIVDFRMSGEIRAPQAPHGVSFHPVSLSPLDGVLFGAKGVVDSRFHFDAISARQTGAFFDTTSAGVNDCQFYFGPITVAADGKKFARIGSAFSHSLLDTADQALAGSTKVADKLDYFEPVGVVVVPPQGSLGDPGTVYLPDGSTLPVAGTKTAGIQEAIDYAASHDLDLAVYGRGLQHKFIAFDGGAPSYPTNGFFQLNAGIKFGPLKNRMVRMYNVTLNFGDTAGAPALEFDATENVDVEITGQLVAMGSPVAISFHPQSGEMKNSRFRIGHFLTNGGTGASFNSQKHSIHDNRFLFSEVLQNAFGVVVAAPSAASCFCANYIRGVHVHGNSQIGVQIGQDTINGDRIADNTFDLMIDPDSTASDVGVQIWGKNNSVFASVRGTGTPKRGVSFEPLSLGNNLVHAELGAVVPIFMATAGANTVAAGTGPLFVGQ